MTITVELALEEAALLASQARLEGIEPVAYVQRLATNDLNRLRPDHTQRNDKRQAGIALLQKWMDEEPSEESAEAVRSWEESHAAISGRNGLR